MENEQNKTTPEVSSEVETNNSGIVPQKTTSVQNVNDIDAFITKRKEFIQKVNAICVEGKDYHVIQGKKSLAKGGAEKIAAIFGWTAKFAKDQETYEMLAKSFPNDALVAYYCWLTKPMEDQFHTLGQGRGAALLSKNAKDPNKTIKMAQKSAFIDAVLRTSGLSDFFTQDLEDMPNVNTAPQGQTNTQNTTPRAVQPVNFEPATQKQIDLIKNLRDQKGYTRDEVIAGVGFKAGDSFNKAAASKFIDWLSAAPKKVKAEVVNDWPEVGRPDEQS